MTKQQTLESLAQNFELPAKIVRDFKALHDVSPELARVVIHELARVTDGPNVVHTATPTASASSATPAVMGMLGLPFDAIAKAIRECGPLTKAAMQQKTGLSEHQIHTVIYKTHQSRFRTLPSASGGRARAYALKEDQL